MLSEMGSEGGAYLADLRLKRGLALDQVVNALAARYQIRISRSALSRYETGARTHPDAILLWGLSHVYAEPLEKMITALGVPVRRTSRTDGKRARPLAGFGQAERPVVWTWQ